MTKRHAADAPSREAVGRRARPAPNKRKRPEDANRGPARRQSLRIGTGKKGRGAELRQRRGSLRRRDRTAEREAKEAAAVVRNTVQLPEYVAQVTRWMEYYLLPCVSNIFPLSLLQWPHVCC